MYILLQYVSFKNKMRKNEGVNPNIQISTRIKPGLLVNCRFNIPNSLSSDRRHMLLNTIFTQGNEDNGVTLSVFFVVKTLIATCLLQSS